MALTEDLYFPEHSLIGMNEDQDNDDLESIEDTLFGTVCDNLHNSLNP